MLLYVSKEVKYVKNSYFMGEFAPVAPRYTKETRSLFRDFKDLEFDHSTATNYLRDFVRLFSLSVIQLPHP